ncbi:MAG TPA: oxaloacetate decarboxylase [Candidatus Limnocylindria bacterium]|nr:oxaloacetate decarboxylase [Candidatus Limnocylindria bacterium]
MTATLRELLARPRILVMPGAYDALTARLVENAGFDALYLSGAGVSYTHLARPDIGLVTLDEMLRRAESICETVRIPVLADGDTGYGNAINVGRTVRAFERAGLSGIQLEDQSFPKRCGHLDGKEVVPAEEMAGKIRAAVDARASDDFIVVARTDAIATDGFDEALRRLRLYAECGADVLFADGIATQEHLAALPGALGRPTLANMVEGGKTPLRTAAELERMGYRVVIFPNSLVRLFARQGAALLAALHESGTTNGARADMLTFDELNALIGTKAILEAGRRYAEEAPGNARD